jgi:deoxyribose-phosphate aldolase
MMSVRDMVVRKTLINNELGKIKKTIKLLEVHTTLYNTLDELDIIHQRIEILQNKVQILETEYKDLAKSIGEELTQSIKKA